MWGLKGGVLRGNIDEENADNIHIQDPVEPTSFWVNPFGVAWPLLKASDLIRVNEEGKVVDGGPCRLLNAAGKISTSPISLKPGIDRKMLTHLILISIYDTPCRSHSSSRDKLRCSFPLFIWTRFLLPGPKPRYHHARFLRFSQRYRTLLLF